MIISQTLRRAVQQHPNGTATIYKDRKQSWREFEGRVARLDWRAGQNAMQLLPIVLGEWRACPVPEKDREQYYRLEVQ